MNATEKLWTYEEYLKLEDEKRYEIIDGELFEMPAPSVKHQKVLWKLVKLFGQYENKVKTGLFLSAPVDVVLSESEVVQPDILYVSEERISIVEERAVRGAPDLVVEIVSPYSYKRDTEDKKRIYANHGVKEYWIVLPELKIIEVLTLEDKSYNVYSFACESGKACSKLLEGFCVKPEEVFE